MSREEIKEKLKNHCKNGYIIIKMPKNKNQIYNQTSIDLETAVEIVYMVSVNYGL